jgi:hypothetical protein
MWRGRQTLFPFAKASGRRFKYLGIDTLSIQHAGRAIACFQDTNDLPQSMAEQTAKGGTLVRGEEGFFFKDTLEMVFTEVHNVPYGTYSI